MSQNNQNGQNAGQATGAPRVAWGTKVGYIGTGVLIGLIIYPFVRRALGKLQPKVDRIFDDLTGKAEDFAEKASDIMAQAKNSLYRNGGQSEHAAHAGHEHEDHSHDHN